ncbi:MAG TPA: hypothetical protein VFI16_03930, partial [Anaeromyxobacteraceae bacterium]|nr:hypothetical protein [Anaeromyxobacteraceae bacterium]
MSSYELHVQTNVAAARTARALLLAVAVETAVTLLHFLHGARSYDDPGRLHVVGPALAALALVAALTGLFLYRPGRLALGALALATAVPFLGVFGLYHGGWSHGLKLAAFHAGASRETLERLFGSPDFAWPDDLVFEASGLLGLAAAAAVALLLARLVRQAHRRKGAGASPGTPGPRALGP